MTQREFALQNELIAKAYGTKQERKKLTKAEKETVATAISNFNKNNVFDDGGKGRSFEIDFRMKWNFNSIVLKCQSAKKSDITFVRNGKYYTIEAKTGGGELANNVGMTADEFNSEWTPENGMRFDYIAYCLDYSNGDVETDTVIFTKTAFIRWLNSWQAPKGLNGWKGILTYKENEERVMIKDPRAGLKKAIENGKDSTPRYEFMKSYIDEINDIDVWDFTTFKETFTNRI